LASPGRRERVASDERSRGAWRRSPRCAKRGAPGAPLVARVPLFLPRIAAVVVAVRLPEAGVVVLEHVEPADPLRALPEVEMRDQQAGRAAVLGGERFARVAGGDPGLPPGHVGEREG